MASTFRYFIYLQYKGRNYHGWQTQPNAITVQEVVDQKLSLLLNEKIETTGAGRTDTGVHAKEFAAHFDYTGSILETGSQFLYKINCLLPPDISVISIREVHENAHARFDATSRMYEYRLSVWKDPFSTDFAWYYPYPLDITKMNEASRLLLDYTDFTSFSKLHTDVKTNNCKLISANWVAEGNAIIFTIEADRFLRNMVRAIVGTLVNVGKGKISMNQFIDIVESRNRSNAGISVPAHGLSLIKIKYPETIFKK